MIEYWWVGALVFSLSGVVVAWRYLLSRNRHSRYRADDAWLGGVTVSIVVHGILGLVGLGIYKVYNSELLWPILGGVGMALCGLLPAILFSLYIRRRVVTDV